MNENPGDFPAFPNRSGSPGMTVRQYYKAAALQGILSSCGFDNHMAQSPEHFTKWAGMIADAAVAEDALAGS